MTTTKSGKIMVHNRTNDNDFIMSFHQRIDDYMCSTRCITQFLHNCISAIMFNNFKSFIDFNAKNFDALEDGKPIITDITPRWGRPDMGQLSEKAEGQ